MNIRFDNKKVLVTGATRGIGKKIAEEFAKNGAIVTITGTGENRPDWCDYSLNYEQLLINSEVDWHSRVDDIVLKYDGFDVLINNAGINKVSTIYEVDKDDISTILLTNLNAPIYIASSVSKKMVKKKYGYIVNIGSIFGVVSKEGRNSYTASKSGLIGVTRTMAIDLGQYNILVNTLSPGFVDTELTRQVLGEDGMEIMREKVPMKKLATVDDIAPAVLFLASEQNTYITGQNIVIDGGFTIE